MNFARRQQPSNRRENDNKWTDRSDNKARGNFGNRLRGFNSGSDNRTMTNFNDFGNFGRSDDRKRENFDDFRNQILDQNIGSVRENSFDNSVRSRDQKFGNDFQKREHFNEFTNQRREKNFGSDFRMRDNSNDIMNDGIRGIYDDYSSLGRNNNLGNDNRMRDASTDFFNTGRDSTLRSDDRIHDFSSHGRVNDLGIDNYMRKSLNDFHNKGYNTNMATNDRKRESVNFRNQGRDNNFLNDDRMPESFDDFGYGNRDKNFRSNQIPGQQIPNKQVDFYQRSEDNTFLKPDPSVASIVGSHKRQNTFDDQDRYFNRDTNKTRDMFRNYLQGTKIQNNKRSNENYLPQTSKISRQNTSINYPKLQEGTKDFVFSKLSNQPIRKIRKSQTARKAEKRKADKNEPEIKIEKTESDVVRTTTSDLDKKIDYLRKGLKDIIAIELSDKREMSKSDKRELNQQTFLAKSKQLKNLQCALARKHMKIYIEKKREMESKGEAMEIQRKSRNFCVIIKDVGNNREQIPIIRQAWFEKAMRNKIENGGARRPVFTFAAFIDGAYRITCADGFAYGWVRDNVPLLKLWKGANLKITRDVMKDIRYILPSPKPLIDFKPISEKDLNADLLDRNNTRGKISMTNHLKIKYAISGLITRGKHLPYIFTRTSQGYLSVECIDLASLQWLYDNLSLLDGLWLDADLRLVQRRTLLYFRKITFTLKRNVNTPIEALSYIVRDNDTIKTGLWKPLQLHPDGRTVSFAIEAESVKDLEAIGSRLKYFEDTIDVQIHPHEESQAKRNVGSPSLIQEIANYELKEYGIADLSGAEDNASDTTDDN